MLTITLMKKIGLLAILALASLSACSFKKEDVNGARVVVANKTDSQEAELILAVRSQSRVEVERLLGEKSLEELEQIVAINGDPMVLVAARRGSIEILKTLREKGLNLWAQNQKTGETLLTDLGVVSIPTDPAMKEFLTSEIEKDMNVAKQYFHKGNIAAGLNALSYAHIPCSVFTRSLLRFSWANPHIGELPFITELVKLKECIPAKSPQELQDFLVLELGARLTYGVSVFNTLTALAGHSNVKIPAFESTPLVNNISGDLVRVKMLYNPLALVYLYEKGESGEEATPEKVQAGVSALSHLIVEPEMVLHISSSDMKYAVNVTQSEIKYKADDLVQYRDFIKADFAAQFEKLSRKYNLMFYALYPKSERSQ